MMAMRAAFGVAALTLLAGCSSPALRMMPTPVLFTAGDAAPFAVPGIADGGDSMQVLYVTNRIATGPDDARRYLGLRSDELRFGVATLQVDADSGAASPPQGAHLPPDPAARPRITLRSAREFATWDSRAQSLGADLHAYLDEIDARLQQGTQRDLLVYVHGANTSFERAAAQAAQFQHYLGRDVVVIVFAWPSAGSLLRYPRDVASARSSEPDLAGLLALLSTHTGARHVSVLAYSAGAMIASPGLARAAATDPEQLRLGEVYFAAPDIDFPVFLANLPHYYSRVRRVTVAVNMGDRALSFSQWLHRVSRAGRPNLADIGPEETQWLVDASKRKELDVLSIRPEDLPGLAVQSHSFWYDHPWVSSDILLKLHFHAEPLARGLLAGRTSIDLAFWRFPPDYAERLPDVVRSLGARSAP